MKTERRHELQTNDLAIWLTNVLQKIGPYKNLVFGGVILAIVAIGLGSYLFGMSKKKQSDAWAGYFEIAFTSERENAGENLEAIADTYTGTSAGLWALNDAGVNYLDTAGDELFTDRESAKKKLNNAIDAFNRVLDQATDPLLRQRALMGLAQSHESLGEFDKAIESYKEIASKFPNSPFVESANEKVLLLEKPETKEWYAWFEQQEVSQPLADPSLFNNLENLPNNPNINIPQSGNLIRPDGTPAGGNSPIAPSTPDAETSTDGNAESTDATPDTSNDAATEDTATGDEADNTERAADPLTESTEDPAPAPE